MARNGKIARLPLHIRNELNERLCEGEPGTKLVPWLNAKSRVLLESDSEGRTIWITEQNLSEWRQGGYQDWLRHEEARDFIDNLSEQAGELDQAADGKGISDRFGALLAVDMARLAKKFLEQETDDEKRWERLKEISKELSRLRRDEHRATWTWIKRQKWERQREREDYEEEETIRKEMRMEAVAPLMAARRVKNLAELYGGGPEGMETAAMILEAREDLEPGSLMDTVRSFRRGSGAGRATVKKAEARRQKAKPAKSKAVGKKPRKSGRIKPNPTKSDQKPVRDSGAGKEGSPLPAAAGNGGVGIGNVAASETDALRPNPTKSKSEPDGPPAE